MKEGKALPSCITCTFETCAPEGTAALPSPSGRSGGGGNPITARKKLALPSSLSDRQEPPDSPTGAEPPSDSTYWVEERPSQQQGDTAGRGGGISSRGEEDDDEAEDRGSERARGEGARSRSASNRRRHGRAAGGDGVEEEDDEEVVYLPHVPMPQSPFLHRLAAPAPSPASRRKSLQPLSDRTAGLQPRTGRRIHHLFLPLLVVGGSDRLLCSSAGGVDSGTPADAHRRRARPPPHRRLRALHARLSIARLPVTSAPRASYPSHMLCS